MNNKLKKILMMSILLITNFVLLSSASYLASNRQFDIDWIFPYDDAIVKTRIRFFGQFWTDLCELPPGTTCDDFRSGYVGNYSDFNYIGVYIMIGLSFVSLLIGIVFTFKPKISCIINIVGAFFGLVALGLFIPLRNNINHPLTDFFSNFDPALQLTAAFYFSIIIFITILVIGIITLYKNFSPKYLEKEVEVLEEKLSERSSKRLSDISQEK